MANCKITKKLFWEMMGTWNARELFLDRLDDYFPINQDIKLRFATRKFIDIQDLSSLDIEKIPSFNLSLHKFLYDIVGEKTFYSYLDNFNKQSIILTANSRKQMRIFLERKKGKDYKTIAVTYKVTESNARQIFHRLNNMYPEI